MKRILTITLSCIVVSVTHLYAQDTEKTVVAKFLIEGGVEYGGDEILEVLFTNGGEQTMRAGQGGYLAVGGHLQYSKVAVRGSVGFKYVTTAADNANIRFTRIPINLVGYWLINDDFRLGIGGTTHQAAILKGDDFFTDTEFTSSIGPKFEVGYKWFGLSYTILDYTDEMDEKFSANSFGVSLSFLLPK